MFTRHRRYEKEEFARRGDDLYDRVVKPEVEPAHIGKMVAIDIETGEWEVDENEIDACRRLEARRPDAQIWIVRVGSRFACHLGAGRRRR